MMDRKLKIMSIAIAAIAAFISLLIFVFGEGVIWRGQSRDPDSLPTNAPTIETTDNNSTTSILPETVSPTADGVTAQPTASPSNSNLDTNENDNSAGDNGDNIKGTVRLRNNENVIGCPQVNIPKESRIAGQTKYEMTWAPFEDATTYRISVWKDANYGTADSNIISVDEVEISGLSYTIDLTALEPGYTYGYNVVVDNHFSSPLLIELY